MSTRVCSARGKDLALQASQSKPNRPSLACNSSIRTTASVVNTEAPQNTSRRAALILPAFLLAAQQLAWADQAQASIEIPGLKARAPRRRGLDQYIQRKQLDPLETYVPVVLQVNGWLTVHYTLEPGCMGQIFTIEVFSDQPATSFTMGFQSKVQH